MARLQERWHQRCSPRSLDILDTLRLYQEQLDQLKEGDTIPKIAVDRDDMQVFLSNTSKLGLFEAGSLMYILRFYSRARHTASGIPTRELILSLDEAAPVSELAEFKREISNLITAGHAVVNFLERQVLRGRQCAPHPHRKVVGAQSLGQRRHSFTSFEEPLVVCCIATSTRKRSDK